ncbi:NADPH:quinone reductase [Chelativorans xinjiangense]|uniref:NADPH:quinone reductase n=1 Tax=Chelativorans xinjiangense TaxID=2681485 RepID=UPI00135C9927|nr:NADPH:quinone reductase [Chelativorans xinjiangense]
MRVAFYTRTGPAREVLEVGEQPARRPEAGEVLVHVRASGINPADVKRRAGWRGMKMDHPLVIPHTDGAGEIVDVGPGVDRSRIGERVWLWNAQGGYGTAGRAFGTAAEYIAILSGQAVRLDDGLSFEAGACLGVPAMTAHRAIYADGPVEGQTILVNGAAGAVGHFAVQLAVAGGARVLGTTSNEAAAAHAKAAGASALIDRKREDLVSRVLELTAGEGVDRLVEVDFAANQAADVAMLKINGSIASYSSSSNSEPVLPYYAFAGKGANLRFIQGFCIPDEARRMGEATLARLAAEGRLKIAIAAAYPLSDIASAHEHVERGSLGNIVVTL